MFPPAKNMIYHTPRACFYVSVVITGGVAAVMGSTRMKRLNKKIFISTFKVPLPDTTCMLPRVTTIRTDVAAVANDEIEGTKEKIFISTPQFYRMPPQGALLEDANMLSAYDSSSDVLRGL